MRGRRRDKREERNVSEEIRYRHSKPGKNMIATLKPNRRNCAKPG
jgi:hypothetical protein